MPPKDAAAPEGGGGRGGDRLSGLRDEVLFRVMGHLPAWEAVRTCLLSTRWRGVWASASRLDIRQPRHCADFARFVKLVRNLLLRRRQLAPLHSLRLRWFGGKTRDGSSASSWIAYAVRHGAEEIELSAEGHVLYPSPEYMSFVVDGDDDFAMYRLRILKLIHVRLDGNTLAQLCSRCSSLEELELKDCQIPEAVEARSAVLKRLTMIKCQIPCGLLVYAPNIVSLHCARPFGYVPWIENLGSPGIVNVVMHRTPDEYPAEYTELVSCNLKILKLSHVHLDDTILRQLCSRCTSLEELELGNCLVEGEGIGSTSLKYLTMISCKFSVGFRVQAPNLVLLRCIRPFQHFPQIQEMEFLATAAIVLDDDCLLSDGQWLQKEGDSDVNSSDESDRGSCNNEHNESDGSSIYYDSDRSAPSDEEDSDRTVGYREISRDHIHKAYKYLIHGHKPCEVEPVEKFYEKHGTNVSDNFGGVETMDLIAHPREVQFTRLADCQRKYESKVSTNSGGVGMLLSLSHVKRMDLLAHPGEVLLTRELKSCTDFKKLKTLSLGEWCITPTFDVLAAMLGHSPNLEILSLHLDMAYNSRVGFNPRASSFECTNLMVVNIICCKHDVMVHTLADFFSVNSVPNDKICVHWIACSGCTGGTRSQTKRKAQSEAEKTEESR
ncbi:unnamed protein product [Urochloa decumbens]|uniref:F-box domain-containing protein n=1 Tax=Urochloa decumbens TaxID=240449 RepID=A0ABC9BKS1_9POAL